MRRLTLLLVSLSVLVTGLGGGVVFSDPAGAAVPAGFTDQVIASVGSPTAMDFTPDGRLLVAQQGGSLRVIQYGLLLPTSAINLSAKLCSNFERGLLGVAVDSSFATNRYVFLYYTFNKAGDCGTATVNRVSRFVMTGNTLGSEVVLIDNIPSPAGNHNGGDLEFAKDNLLYISVGDGGCDYPGGTPSGCAGANDAARDPNAPVGKILRIDRDGGIPAANPFTGAGTGRCNNGVIATNLKCQETFASGLRNPFRMGFDPNGAAPKFHINDVGQSAWEEIDDGVAGADYGWNAREGHCATGSTTNCSTPPVGMTNPIFDYGRSDGCVTITGGAFVPDGVWPAAYEGKYLFADYGCGKIFRLDPNGSGGFNRVDFATGLGGGSAVDLTFGPWKGSQALYYTTYTNGGQVHMITTATTTAGDYNGDAKADIGVFRPSIGTWFVRNATAIAYGTNGDIPVGADYDGDGITDQAVYRPDGAGSGTGIWYVRRSTGGETVLAYGTNTDIPAPADYDGDSKADFAVYRPGSGTWFVRQSTGGESVTVYGTNGDIPVPTDYTGDGRADLAVFRPSNSTWYLRGQVPDALAYGTSGDIPVPADYTGDGKSDIAVFRPSNGTWYLRGQSLEALAYGTNGDIPVPGDYDGNGHTDFAVFRPSNSTWYMLGASPEAVAYGTSGDVPLWAMMGWIRRFFF
ncbi:MAG TPA: PQQ-dependent sugar dehydrogenase [Acidimicrobiales bacterium]|nr:PQQ-dependent sugar dehydrogenase [Acidimicrobiales bacterium]